MAKSRPYLSRPPFTYRLIRTRDNKLICHASRAHYNWLLHFSAHHDECLVRCVTSLLLKELIELKTRSLLDLRGDSGLDSEVGPRRQIALLVPTLGPRADSD